MDTQPAASIPEDELTTLRRKVSALETMTELSALLSSALDLQELMPLVIDRAKQDMDAEACSILLYNRDTNKLEFEVAICTEDNASDVLKKTISLDMGQGIAGWVAEQRKTLIIEDAKSDPRFFTGADAATGFVTRNMIAVPLVGRSGLIGVAEIINYRRQDYNIDLIELLCRQFAISIENALYHRDALKRERLQQELEIAATVQQSFLPPVPSLSRGKMTISAISRPASQIGGDLYDFVEPADGLLGLLVGDVSGKGISAALFMAKVISEFRFHARGEASPGAVLSALNSTLAGAPRGMFVTALYVIADTKNDMLQIACAGHPPAISISDGNCRTIEVPSGPPVGIMDFSYPSTMVPFASGNRILVVTDGVFDAKNQAGERWGYDAMLQVVSNHTTRPDLMQIILDHVDAFADGAPQADDTTIAEIRTDEQHQTQ